MGFIFHGFFSTKRWHKYFFNLTARSKRRQLIIEISWNFSKIQKWSLFFLIFSALYVTQLFFRFDGRIKVSPSQHLNSEKFLIDHIMGFIFHDFSQRFTWGKYFFDLPARSKCGHHKIFHKNEGVPLNQMLRRNYHIHRH